MNKFDSAYKYANEVIASNKFPFDNSANFVTNRFNEPVYQEAIFYFINESSGRRFQTLAGSVNKNLNLFITYQTYLEGTSGIDRRAVWYSNPAPNSYGVKKYPFNQNFTLPIIHTTEISDAGNCNIIPGQFQGAPLLVMASPFAPSLFNC